MPVPGQMEPLGAGGRNEVVRARPSDPPQLPVIGNVSVDLAASPLRGRPVAGRSRLYRISGPIGFSADASAFRSVICCAFATLSTDTPVSRGEEVLFGSPRIVRVL